MRKALLLVLAGAFVGFAYFRCGGSGERQSTNAVGADAPGARHASGGTAADTSTRTDAGGEERRRSSTSIQRLTEQERRALLRTLLARLADSARRSRIDAEKMGKAPSAAARQPAEVMTEQDVSRQVNRAMREVVPLLRECYDLATTDGSRPRGTLLMQLSVVADEELGGVIEEIEVADDSGVRNDDLSECVRESLYALKLPPPREGVARVVLRYPLMFKESADAPTPPPVTVPRWSFEDTQN